MKRKHKYNSREEMLAFLEEKRKELMKEFDRKLFEYHEVKKAFGEDSETTRLHREHYLMALADTALLVDLIKELKK